MQDRSPPEAQILNPNPQKRVSSAKQKTAEVPPEDPKVLLKQKPEKGREPEVLDRTHIGAVIFGIGFLWGVLYSVPLEASIRDIYEFKDSGMFISLRIQEV